MTASSCKFGTQDLTEVRMNDGQALQLRMATNGFFISSVQEPLNDIINESVQTYLRDAHWRWAEMKTNKQLFTELVEMELGELEAEFPELIRYTHIEPVTPSIGGDALAWRMEVFFEQAVAACTIRIEMKQKAND